MMKKIFMILLLVVGRVYAQQPAYLTFTVVPESSPGACDAEVHIQPHGLKPPLQVYYGTGHRVGNELDIYELCGGSYIGVYVLDSMCVEIAGFIQVAAIPDSQVQISAVSALLPSTTGGTDGSFAVTVDHNVGVTYVFETSSSSTPTGDTAFTGLSEGKYYFKVQDYSGSVYLSGTEIRLSYSTPVPCDHDFDQTAEIYDAAPGVCNGYIQAIPSTGTTGDYYYVMYGYGSDPPVALNDPTMTGTYESYATSVCPQPFVMLAGKNSVLNYHKYYYRAFFLGVDSSATFSWTPPGVIPPGTDTFLLSATYTCGLDYSIPVDTVYIDTMVHVGGNLYDFTIVVIQDTLLYEVTGMMTVDTSGSFFLDFTLYCQDSVVSRDAMATYSSMRHLVFYGNTLPLPVEEEQAHVQVEIYPNPATEQVTVRGKRPFSSIQVFSASGEKIQSVKPAASTSVIDVRNWPSAVYLLKYTDERGVSGFARFVKL